MLQLFFIDTGPFPADDLQLAAASDEKELRTSSAEDSEEPAWVDSDDDQVRVSLSSNPRLRKLRVTAAEDVISGREYTKRLRRQSVFLLSQKLPDAEIPTDSRLCILFRTGHCHQRREEDEGCPTRSIKMRMLQRATWTFLMMTMNIRRLLSSSF